MKKYIAILILILFCQAGYSQSMNKLFNDFAKQKNVTHVTVGWDWLRWNRKKESSVKLLPF